MGSAWQGDWWERIHQRVQARGFKTVTEFADSRPHDSLLALADELGQDVAAVQVETMLYEEAKQRQRIRCFLNSLLVRNIREQLPDGWNVADHYDFNYRRASAYANWISALEKSHQDIADLLWEKLEAADIPRGWLPSGPDDPILIRACEGVSFNEQ